MTHLPSDPNGASASNAPARYERLREIAQGASGRVYQARDRISGAAAALKILLHVEPKDLESLRREVRALERIQHPGIVRILHAGLDDTPPWYAMELIEGGTLADLWRRDEAQGRVTTPPTELIARSLRLLERLCEPLSFLHCEGIVHRDIKPGNIGIRGGDDPVIVDFGLVAQFAAPVAREALETGGLLAGTVHYMAPEQARGEYVDARADLYSLGCILHEAITGRPPFIGEPWQVLQKHLEIEPERIDPATTGADPRLCELVASLLVKEPRGRLGYAEDVAQVLREVSGAVEAPRRTRNRTYLYRPSFAGRAPEMLRVRRALDEVKGGRGRLLLVGGESGTGKTRLAMEATREASARGLRVITGECIPTEGSSVDSGVRGAPLHPLRSLLRAVADQCAQQGPAATDRLLGRRAKVLAPYEPALMQAPGFHDQPDPPPLQPQAQRERILADLSDTLADLSRDEPVLLVLDDLQWADDMTLAWLDRLGAGFLDRARLLLLGTYRLEEAPAELARIAAARGGDTLVLSRLAPSGVGSIVMDMLGAETPPHALVRLVARESEGNPFFVGEYLRAAIEAQFLRREPGGRWLVETTDQTGDPERGTLPLPTTLRELIERRLANLDWAPVRALEAAAVLGREFEGRLAGALGGLDPATALDAFGMLVRRQVLDAVERDRFRFVHDKLREVAYGRIPEPRVIGLHRSAAAAIEAAESGQPGFEARYAELAHHWSRAGVSEKAVDYFARSGAHALRAGAYNNAHHWIMSALALDERKGRRAGALQRASWQRMLGEAAFGIGDLAASIRYSAEALAGFGEPVPESRLGWAGLAAVEVCRRVVGSQRAAEGQSERMREVASGCAQIATSYFYEGDPLRAAASLLRGLTRAERAGADASILETSARLGYVAGTLRLHRLSRRWFARAYATSRRIDAPGGRGLTLYLDAQYQQNMGRWSNGYQFATESADLLGSIGDLQEAEVARTIAANNLFYAGDIERANATLAHAAETADRRSHHQHMAWHHFLTGRSLLVEGDLERAIALCAQAAEMLDADRDLLSVAMCDGTHAAALWQAGRRDDAIGVADRLTERLASGRKPLISQCLDGYGALAEVYLARWEEGETATAKAAGQAACGSLRWFARVFPMAVSAAQRATARERWLRGAHAGALRAWRRSVQAAKAIDMPYWEARAHQDLARRAPRPAERELHRNEAHRLFTALGARRHLEELDAP